ncbi:MAG: hypothetical protein ACKPKO_30965 [Candidatus Fonsibacter sp.]
MANSGAILLSINSGTTTLTSMAPTVFITFHILRLQQKYVYSIREINGIEQIIGSGIFSGTKRIIRLFTIFGCLLSATSNTTFSRHLFRSD